MKITLINPPFEKEYSVGESKSVRYVLNVVQPLGLAYLANVLEENKFAVDMFDFTVSKWDKNAKKRIASGEPKIIGLTATTPGFETAKYIAGELKKELPEAIFVIGGAHITAMPYQAMDESCFDAGIIGEGEQTFLELAKHVQENGTLGSVNGIIFRDKQNYIITPKREFIADLDSIPFPARHLLPALGRYRPTPASYKRLPVATIMTSRGCPSQCVFCFRGIFGNAFRQRSAENILAEVDEVVNRYGAREIRFFDDLFTLDKERTYQVCLGMRKRKIPWTCLTAVNAVTKDLLGEMKNSGCWQVLYGLESGSERMLGLLKKGNTIQQNSRAVGLAQEAGLSVRADFIVGTPGETKDSMRETLKFALDMDLDYAHFNKFVPFPGTELYSKLVSQGHKFDFKKCSIIDHSALVYVPEGISRQEYREFLDSSFRKFYLRPKYIFKRLLSINSMDELIGQIRGLLAIAGL
jgi:anaerobic magnesium-protoporphyrin IX monomethyl ester cyclase